jgi:hypothetical protein
LVPHAEVETVLADVELDDAAGEEAAALLVLQPARTPNATATTTAAAARVRPRKSLFMCSAFS